MSPRTQAETYPILFFDGYCHLCQGSVQWVLRHDRRGIVRFAPLQSAHAKRLLKDAPHPLPDSLVLYDGGQLLFRSEAVLRLLRHMGGPWPWVARIFRLVPAFARDALYDFVARRRARWFGRSEACFLPTAEWKARFLE